MHVVTISASFGAGGSIVGPAVAERLGVPFLDRAIPASVAAELGIPLEEALANDEQVQSRFSRWLTAAAPLSIEWMAGCELPPVVAPEQIVEGTVKAIRRMAASGGVVLGRAGAIVLRDHPGALHVRLDGDRERRIRQAVELKGMSEEEARAAQPRNDAARTAYVRHFHRADPALPCHYDMVLDSTRLPIPVCVELIVTAARATAVHGVATANGAS
ncbi:Cytidylate kinase [Pseudonocardia thermophila]|jgi:Cytidylate kinase|uniref:Cytidylate kinase n=1 Tax=Pseudonocardia thermophila TaxID=1848 RepID=A0A1M6P7I5_PSETH|nr:cytidylate kinase-like family protein [Pseudonocardia thermophila]SHK03866.1 Cytidylate kinase [Pseudonocardia thermophila]